MGLYQPAIAAVSMPLTDGCFSSIIWLQQNCVLVQSCTILCNPMDCSLPGSSVHGGKNTQVGCHFLLLGIFPTQGSNSHLLHWQVDRLPSAKIVNIILANHSSKEAIIPLIYYRWLNYILIAQSFSISNSVNLCSGSSFSKMYWLILLIYTFQKNFGFYFIGV